MISEIIKIKCFFILCLGMFFIFYWVVLGSMIVRKHDGRRNLYAFEKRGEKHTLFPALKEESAVEENKPKVLLISRKEFV